MISLIDLYRSQHRLAYSWGMAPKWEGRLLNHSDTLRGFYARAFSKEVTLDGEPLQPFGSLGEGHSDFCCKSRFAQGVKILRAVGAVCCGYSNQRSLLASCFCEKLIVLQLPTFATKSARSSRLSMSAIWPLLRLRRRVARTPSQARSKGPRPAPRKGRTV